MAKYKGDPKHYINNREFYEELVEYNKQKELDPNTPVPLCLWEKFIILAKRTASPVNYSSYSYKLEFIDEAVLHCVLQIDMFDINKSTNPYSYFRNAVNRVMLQFIKREKKESYKKDICLKNYNSIINEMINDTHNGMNPDKVNRRNFYGH